MSGHLTLEQAKTVITHVLNELAKPAIASAILTARRTAGNDINAMMTEVVPIFYEIQGTAMQPYGFHPNDEGFAAFAEELKKHETNAEFNELSKQLKALMKSSATPLTPEEEEALGASEGEEDE